MANKRKKSWFFQSTNVLRADGTTGGIRFRKRDKPTQETFEDLTASTTFSTEADDRAKVYNGNPIEQGDQQGLATLATDAQAKSNQTQLTNQSLVVQPHQLPTNENLDAAILEDMPTSTMDVSIDGATTTRNKYFFRLSLAWLTWLVSRLFKSGGSAGDIPIKNSATDYDWSWGNLADSAGFISSLLANTTFLSGLATNNNFIDFLINNTTFVSGIATNTIFKENIETQDSITKDAFTKNLKLVGDIDIPGTSKYYGTDPGGFKGFFSLPTVISDTNTLTVSDFRFDTGWSIDSASGDYWYTIVDKMYTINYNFQVQSNIVASGTPYIFYIKLKGGVTRTSNNCLNYVVVETSGVAGTGDGVQAILTTIKAGTGTDEAAISGITGLSAGSYNISFIGQISLRIV
jgi:hypothetical protein